MALSDQGIEKGNPYSIFMTPIQARHDSPKEAVLDMAWRLQAVGLDNAHRALCYCEDEDKRPQPIANPIED